MQDLLLKHLLPQHSAILLFVYVAEFTGPINAIQPDTDAGTDKWVQINTKYSELWPNITKRRPEDVPADQEKWRDVGNKLQYLSEKPGKGD